jgi:hypothetical protein
MLVRTAIVALLAAAPALVDASAPASVTSKEETIVKVNSVITSINEKQATSRTLLTRPIVPLADLGPLERSRIGRAGGPHIAAQYNRNGVHYKQRKAGIKEHNYTADDWVRLENILEAAERVVNQLEDQMNKAETVFPEVEAANRRMQKVSRTKMAAATKVASATPAKSG